MNYTFTLPFLYLCLFWNYTSTSHTCLYVILPKEIFFLLKHFCLYGESRAFLTTCISLILRENVDLPRRDIQCTRVRYPCSPLLTLPHIGRLPQKSIHITQISKEARSIPRSVSNTNMADVLTCLALSTCQHLICSNARTYGCGYYKG